jgi:hypothetical protein
MRASSKICWATCYHVFTIGPPTIYIHAPNSIVLSVRGCVRSPTLDERWPGCGFINECNPHLKIPFCNIVLDATKNSNKEFGRHCSPCYMMMQSFYYYQQDGSIIYVMNLNIQLPFLPQTRKLHNWPVAAWDI